MTSRNSEIVQAWNSLSPTPTTLDDGVAKLSALTVMRISDTDGASMRGLLYTRAPAGKPSSLERLQSVAAGLETVTTPASGYSSAQVVVLAQELSDILQRGDPFQMTVAAVATKATSDLSVLMGSKLADGHGILWAPGELASGDPGDAAVLMGTLVNLTVPVFQPPVARDELWIALGRPMGMN